jgi:uncharacterized protein
VTESRDELDRVLPAGQRMTWEEYSHLCRLLARTVAEEFKPEVIVGIAEGGVIAGATISSLLHLDFFPIKFSRRVNDQVVRKRPKLLVPPTAHLEGKRVLIVDDASISGETMRAALHHIQQRSPLAVATAVLVRRGAYAPDYSATYSKKDVNFPWIEPLPNP